MLFVVGHWSLVTEKSWASFFQAVHLLTLRGENEISNLTDKKLNLLQLFPKPCQKYYLLV
ncbi:MAG: hypothetical protein ACOC1Z_02600 [Cyanobacteriota bacterium]